jgi:hypothetical protein
MRAVLPDSSPDRWEGDVEPRVKDRSSAISWDGHEAKAVIAVRAIRRQGPTFGEVAREWWTLVEDGTYARRRGRGKPLSATTVADYRAVLLSGTQRRGHPPAPGSLVLIDRCGERPIAALTPIGSRSSTSSWARESRIPGSPRTSR